MTNIANNTATVLANNPQVATAQRPSRAFSTINVTYGNPDPNSTDPTAGEPITIGSGGTITVDSEQATIDNVNSSIGVTSENVVFAEANADNGAAASSFANSNILLNVLGDRPGAITLNVADINFGELSAIVTTNGINNLDSRATSDGENAIATPDNTSSNIIVFDSAINSALISFDLNVPDVDYVIDAVTNLPVNKSIPVAFNACPVNAAAFSQQQPEAIETSLGKIYPARGIAVENGQIRLTAKPTAKGVSRSPVQFAGCN